VARSDLTVYISGDTRGLTKATARASTQLASFGRDGEKSMGRLKQAAIGAGLAIGSVAAGGLVFGLKKAVEEAREAAKVTAQTEAVIRSTGGAANVSAKQLEELANRLSLVSGKDDELIQKGGNLLLTFKGIRDEAGKGNDIFTQATRTTLDLAAAMAAASGGQINMKTAAIQVGKALNDPIAGLTALTRVGVTFNERQKERITGLVESGRLMQAQKVILKELKSEFGGSAAANADALDKLGVAINNVFERFGTKLVPVITKAATWLSKFIIQMETGKGAGGEFARTMADVAAGIADVFQWTVNAYRNLARINLGEKIAAWFVEAVRKIKSVWGDGMAFILRRMADLYEVMAKVPIIGKKFQAVADKVNAAADKVDKLGQKVRKLPAQKEIKVMVKVALSDLEAGNVAPLTPLDQLPAGGPDIEGAIGGMAKRKARRWAKKNASRLMAQANPLMGQPGMASGKLGQLEALGHRMGLVTSSGYRPGDDGWHGQNRARDISGSAPLMMQYARTLFSRFGSSLLELIYTPMGIGIKNGKPVNIQSFYGPAVAADHYDHVHVAMQRGGVIPGKRSGDRIPALLEEGEGIINRKAVDAMGGPRAIRAINRAIPRFAGGGIASLNRIFPEHGLGEAGFTMSFDAVRRVFEAVGASPRMAYMFATIAKGESGLRPGIRGDDPGGTKGWGLVQNTPGVWSTSSKTYRLMQRLGGEAALRNPFVNAKVAMSLYNEGGGWRNWYGTSFFQDPGEGVSSALTRADRAWIAGGRKGERPSKKAARKEREKAVRGRMTTPDIISGTQDWRHEQRWTALTDRNIPEGGVTKRERRQADRAYRMRQKVLNERIKKARARIKVIRKELRKKLRPATRDRLLRELDAQLGNVRGWISESKTLTTDFQSMVTPEEGEAPNPLQPNDVAMALAGLTPGTDDDLAVLREREGIAGAGLALATAYQSPEAIIQWAGELKSTRDAIESLTGAMAEANRLAEERDAINKQIAENQSKILLYANTQGPALIGAVVAAANGGIGGKFGLGNQTPSFAGVGGLARY
jgi:hypothetical protein